MAETSEEKYLELLTRPVPREGLILPRDMADIIQSMDRGDQPTSDYDRLLLVAYPRLAKRADS